MSRGRPVRFGAPGEVAFEVTSIPALDPAVFMLRFGGVERRVDLAGLPCPRLVRPLAGALASIGGDNGTVRRWSPGFQELIGHVQGFVAFAAEQGSDLGSEDVSPALLDGFEARLSDRYGIGAGPVEVRMRTVVRLLRLAHEAAPGSISLAMQGRLGYVTTTPCCSSTPLNAYPMPAFEAIRSAALADVRAISERIDAGWCLATAGSDPQTAGWSRRENVLWHVAAHGALVPGEWRQMHVVRCAPGGIRGVNAQLFLTPADLIPLLVGLICTAGLEPECAKSLRADCLSSPARGFVTLAYEKRRARPHTAKSMRVRDGGLSTPGGLIRLASRLSEPARKALGSDALWVGAGAGGFEAFFDSDRELGRHLRSWAGRNHLSGLIDYGGKPVRLDLRRLRKTVKSQAYLRSGGVLDDFATGHTKPVAAARYADIEAHRELHEHAVETGLRQALHAALAPPVVATPSGSPLTAAGTAVEPLTPAQIQAAVTAAQDVFLASCTDFYASPFARKPGGACPVAVWGCLECPNAVFTERHLPSLVNFAGFLEAQRDELPAQEWQARYTLAHERLNTGILPAFGADSLDQARQSTESAQATTPVRLLEQLA